MHPRPFKFQRIKAVVRVSDDFADVAIANAAANLTQRGFGAGNIDNNLTLIEEDVRMRRTIDVARVQAKVERLAADRPHPQIINPTDRFCKSHTSGGRHGSFVTVPER